MVAVGGLIHSFGRADTEGGLSAVALLHWGPAHGVGLVWGIFPIVILCLVIGWFLKIHLMETFPL